MCACVCVPCASPCTQPCGLDGSAILRCLPAPVASPFTAALPQWLPPHTHCAGLLYRASLHGMTPAAFHGRCDGTGPTLALIRADEGGRVCVFGGYTGAPWQTGPRVCVAAPSWLFSVCGPWGEGPTHFPSRPGGGGVRFHPCAGPSFGTGGDVYVGSGGGGPDTPFNGRCAFGPMRGYGDTLRKGALTFTGTPCFTPVDIEVFRVVDDDEDDDEDDDGDDDDDEEEEDD